jgi:hypothetical protein
VAKLAAVKAAIAARSAAAKVALSEANVLAAHHVHAEVACTNVGLTG